MGGILFRKPPVKWRHGTREVVYTIEELLFYFVLSLSGFCKLFNTKNLGENSNSGV